MPSSRIRLGTRASALARWQADWVAAGLREHDIEVELVPISTVGDRQQEPIKKIGAQGLFTKEIQRALLDDRIDLAVHSLKDLPTEKVDGLCLAAVPERAAVADVLVSPDHASFEALPQGATIGTGSLRRQAQLLHARPDLQVRDIRGNVDTRLKKAETDEFDAIILAEAGLRRLELQQHITEQLPLSLLLPAIGQGALGLETRSDDTATRDAVMLLDHAPSHQAVVAERAMLAALQGGCLAPIGAWGRVKDEQLTLTGRVLSNDGAVKLETTQSKSDAVALGDAVAEELLAQGAGKLVQDSRESL
jgi:hydroxymethylbilane synthase